MSISTVTPGNIVVPLSEVIAQLQGKLDDAQIEALLTAVLGGRPTQVRPGDPISASLMNQVLFQLADHALRLARLEAGTTVVTPGQVVIFEPAQGAQLRVGETIQVTGLNFAYTGARQRVTFDETPVSGYADGSGDNLLRVVVPTVPNLGAGRAVVLNVSNGTSTAARGITVLPPDQPLTGTVDIQAQPTEPSPLVAGSNADFPFRLNPRGLNRSAEFQLTPTLAGQNWSANLRLLNAGRAALPGGRVTVAPEQPVTVYVRLEPVPADSGGQGFSLALALAAGPLTPSSPPTSHVVGAPPPPFDGTLTFTANTASPANTLAGGAIRLPEGGFNNVSVDFASSRAGGPFRYEVSLELIPATPGGALATGWTFGFLQPATNPPSQPQATTPNLGNTGSVLFAVVAGTDASLTGRLRLRVQRQGDPLGNSLEFQLIRTS